MNLFDLLFGQKSIDECQNKLSAYKGEVDASKAENVQLQAANSELKSNIDDANKHIADLMLKNQELTSQINNLNNQIKTLQDHQTQINADDSEAGRELENITYRMQAIINNALGGVDFIWRDKGYLVQINTDSKVDGNYSVLRDRVNVEMQNCKYCQMQEINNRTFFIKIRS